MTDLLKLLTAYFLALSITKAAQRFWNQLRDDLIADTLMMAEDLYKLNGPFTDDNQEVDLNYDIWDRPEVIEALRTKGWGHYSSTLGRIIFLPQNRIYSDDELPELVRLVEVISDPEGIDGSMVSFLIGMSNLFRFMRELPYDHEVVVLVPPDMHKYYLWETSGNASKEFDWQVSNIAMEIFPDLDDFRSFPVVLAASSDEAVAAYDERIIDRGVEDFKFLLSGVGMDWHIFLPGGDL